MEEIVCGLFLNRRNPFHEGILGCLYRTPDLERKIMKTNLQNTEHIVKNFN